MSMNELSIWPDTASSHGRIAAEALKRLVRGAFLVWVIAVMTLHASPTMAQNREKVKVIFEQALPNVQGKKMVAVTVSYPAGAKSLSHRHAASAFIYAYVLSGTVRSQVDDQPAKVYHVGEFFYEVPGSHHRISQNASNKEPASLLAVFVVDAKDAPLTTPDKGTGSQ